MASSKKTLPFRLPPPENFSAGGAGGHGCDLLVMAGEHSGDEHAARAVAALRARQPGLRICALGGPQLAAAGAQLLHDLTASSVVGFVEVLRSYSFFKTLFEEVLRWIAEYRPRAVCFVDYPGLHLRLAAALRERGLSHKGGGPVRLLYYISPQIWAWKPKRRFAMARDLDALAVIFPFEVECYADTDLPVEFVGHPFLSEGYAAPVAYDPEAPILLLPGSRRQAVARILPVLLRGLAAYEARLGKQSAERGAVGEGERAAVEATILYPSGAVLAEIRAAGLPEHIRCVPTGGGALHASAVLTSSGTMSLHCALAGIPGAIAYRTNPLTYLLARYWVRLDYIGIANLLLREPMYPEFIQGAAKPAALAEQLYACRNDPARREKTAEQAARLRTLLNQPANGANPTAAGATTTTPASNTVADWLARWLT
ncbi:lipid-A-disaccharide synthase [Cephaloticoccus primus]|uniref:lipid-A-disaccharide synthase n=1 Tax=Cephaloticoccus primus TaxID=1548207 RepID=UPI0009EF5AF5|nr:lipid-A-disaccharide synthase [Cephaloticoccus primus]